MLTILEVALIGMVLWLVMYAVGRILTRISTSSGIPQKSKPRPRTPALAGGAREVTVTTEDQLLVAINDVLYGYSHTLYVVEVDARNWDFDDRQNALWLRNHPQSRIQIDFIQL